MSRSVNEKGRKVNAKSYAGIPRVVMESDKFKSLSGSAVKLLLELSYQFRGHNNGDLTTAFTVLRERGWKARGTVDKAKQELLAADLIVCTREGRFMNPGGVCALYGLRWQPIQAHPAKFILEDIPSAKRRPRLF